MSFFDINSLVDDALVINRKKHTVYEKILFKIYNKIKVVNKKKKFQLCYEVPNYLFGYALYDVKTCIVFIMVALRKKQMVVKYINPNILVISWENLLKKSYNKMINQEIRMPSSNKSKSSFNSINMHRTQSITEKNKKLNMNKINNNIVKGFNTKVQTNQSSDTISHSSIDDLLERSKYF